MSLILFLDLFLFFFLFFSAALGQRAVKQSLPHNYTCRNRTTCMHRNRKPCNPFFMVNMASGMDHGHVCPYNDGQLAAVKTRYLLRAGSHFDISIRISRHTCMQKQ